MWKDPRNYYKDRIVAHHKDLNQRVSCYETKIIASRVRRAVRPFGDKLIEALPMWEIIPSMSWVILCHLFELLSTFVW
ncbi:unnamed protein product [Cylicocyclus nassatus]|uniref:Uncharacterized protein n=1 Tax=Cylicocyclus nassatus TaxID=53992 RepID=A0AA36GS57_CYLNA|nr:unnamed protein product [Cylicocyclus nassatus]